MAFQSFLSMFQLLIRYGFAPSLERDDRLSKSTVFWALRLWVFTFQGDRVLGKLTFPILKSVTV